jgi:hypothetical protein
MQDSIEPDLYELGRLIGLDPEIHEDLQDLEDMQLMSVKLQNKGSIQM